VKTLCDKTLWLESTERGKELKKNTKKKVQNSDNKKAIGKRAIFGVLRIELRNPTRSSGNSSNEVKKNPESLEWGDKLSVKEEEVTSTA